MSQPVHNRVFNLKVGIHVVVDGIMQYVTGYGKVSVFRQEIFPADLQQVVVYIVRMMCFETVQAEQYLTGATQVKVEADAIVQCAFQTYTGYKTFFDFEAQLPYLLLQVDR